MTWKKASIKGAAVAMLLAGTLASGCASWFGGRSDVELRQTANDALRAGEYERVIALDSEILRRAPDDYDAVLQRGIAFDRLGRDNVAMADYSRSIELDPSKPLPRLYRANLALRMGQGEAALMDVSAAEALELKTNERVAALTLKGTVQQMRASYPAAIGSYGQAVSIARQDPDLHSGKHYRDALHNLAQCYYHVGDFASALASMNAKVRAMELAGQRLGEEEHYMLGLFSYLTGDFPTARDHFTQVSPARRKKAAEVLDDPNFFAG